MLVNEVLVPKVYAVRLPLEVKVLLDNDFYKLINDAANASYNKNKKGVLPMAKTAQVSIRIDENLKNRSNLFFESCGISFNQGIQILLRKVLVKHILNVFFIALNYYM